MLLLLQGAAFDVGMAVRALSGCTRSSDAQIQYWEKFRQIQKETKFKEAQHLLHKVVQQPVLVKQNGYLASLRKALEDDDKMAESVMASFVWENMSVAINMLRNGSNTSAVGFIGDLSAKIGFLLDFAAVSAASDTADDTDTVAEDESDDQEGPDMLWVLEGCGFDMINVLLWIFNFKRFSTLTAKDFSKSLDGNADLLELHRALITASQARVLLICGPCAEQAVSTLAKSIKIYTLEAQSLRYKMRILKGYEDIRLCICCPEFLSRSWSCSLEY